MTESSPAGTRGGGFGGGEGGGRGGGGGGREEEEEEEEEERKFVAGPKFIVTARRNPEPFQGG